MLRRRALALLLVLTWAQPKVWCEDERYPERLAAEQALAASEGGARAQALEALAKRPSLDPWLVAERLRVRTDAATAEAFARRAAPDDGRLQDYLGRAPLIAFDAAIDAAQDAAWDAIEAEQWDAGAAHAGRGVAALPSGSVWRLDLAMLRAMCLDAAGSFEDASTAWNAIGRDAWALGWAQGARLAFGTAFTIAEAAGLWVAARDADLGVLAVQHAQRDLHGQAHTKFELAQIAKQMGDLAAAQRHLHEAILLYDGVGDAEHGLEARMQRCDLLAEAGLLRDALDEQDDIADRLKDPRHADLVADSQRMLARLHWWLGDLDGARRALKDAEAGATSTKKPASDRAETLGVRALIERESGQHGAASASLREALALLRGEGGAHMALVAQANLADALLLQAVASAAGGEPVGVPAAAALLDEADRLLRAALEDLRERGMVSAVLAAEETMGRLHLARGEREAGLDVLRRVAGQAEAIGQWRTVVEARSALAAALVHDARWKEAMDVVRDGLRVLEVTRSELAAPDRLASMQVHVPLHDLGVSASVGAQDLAQAFRFLESGRAAALLRGLGGRTVALRAGISRTVVDELQAASAQKRAAVAAYHQVLGKPGARQAWEAYEAALKREDVAYTRVQREEESLARRLIPPQPRSLTSIQARLAEVEATGRPCRMVAFSMQRDGLLGFVLGPHEARVVVYPADATRDIHVALTALVGHLSLPSPRWTDRPGFVRTPPAALDALRTHLVKRLGLPQGRLVLLVCPDEELAFVPFRLLLDDAVEVALQPSASVWDQLMDDRILRGEGVLAVGNPDYRTIELPGLLAARGGLALRQLVKSAEEVAAVASDGPPDTRLLGRDASEARVRLELAKHAKSGGRLRSVHLACHGLVDVEWPSLSSLALTAGGGEDGFLTAGEVLRFEVPADLVVLSACRSSQGRVVLGEGVLSLARAFMHARAPRVLASLWDVDDAATAFLMSRFYEHWRSGRVGVAEALRLAQEATRTHEFEDTVYEEGKPPRREKRAWWADPEYWAAWVLWGLPD